MLFVRVYDRISVPMAIAYSPPLVTGLKLLAGLKNETVTLEIAGNNLGLACTVCPSGGVASAVPLCTTTNKAPSDCSLLACSFQRIPNITIANENGTALCLPLCVDPSTGTSSIIRCKTNVPIAIGAMNVTVGNQTHANIKYDYEVLLPTPTLSGAVSPAGAPCDGARLSVWGSNLGTSGAVYLTNDLGTQIILASPYNATYFEVSCPIDSAGGRVLLLCCWRKRDLSDGRLVVEGPYCASIAAVCELGIAVVFVVVFFFCHAVTLCCLP